MRKYSILLAAAPIALLAACGGETEQQVDTADTDTAMTDDATASDSYEDGPATKLADAGDYSGAYTYVGEDGTKRRVSVNSSDKTYSYTDADGNEQTGTYTVADDGYRFRIESFYGGPGWFTIRDGWLVRLDNEDEVTGETVVRGERYQRDDDGAVFSYEPELGSQRVPEDLMKKDTD